VHCKIVISDGTSSQEIVSVRASFGPSFISPKENLAVIFIEDACTDYIVNSTSDYVVLTNRWGKTECSYLKRTLIAQSKGASAIIVINDEKGLSIGLLFTMQEDFSGRGGEATISAFLTTSEDGELLKSNPSYRISISDSKDFGIAWEFYVWLFFSLNLFLFFMSCYYLVLSFLKKSTYHLKITFSLQFIYSLSSWIDMLVNHWGIRGIIQTKYLHIFYGVPTDALIISFAHIAWLWYSLVSRKNTIIAEKILRKRQFIALVVLIVVADVIKLCLYGADYGIRISWGVYNSLLSLACILLSTFLSITGWRLRKEINRFEDNQSNRTFVISLIALITAIGFIMACISLVLWISVPTLFGKWSWFIYNFAWRSFQVFYSGLLLFVFGFRSTLRRSASDRTSNNATPLEVRVSIDLPQA